MNRIAVLIVALIAACGAHAQAWPTKPIRMVVPFAAGGPTDQLARKASQALATSLGVPVVVENILGAGGAIGANRVAKSPADGYTLIMGAKAMMVIAPQMNTVTYNTLTDFQPVSGRAVYAYTLLVNNAEPSANVADIIAKSKNTSVGINYGSSGFGGGAYFAAEHLRAETKANFTHVPFSGTLAALNALLGGQIDLALDTGANPFVFVKSGRLKAIGVTSKKRSKLLPDVPAVAEFVPGFEDLGWYAFFAPKGLPSEVAQKLQAEFATIFRSKDFIEFLERSDMEAVIETPEVLNGVVAADIADVQRLIKKAGIKPQ
ncbi:MAG: tripartite tricarboxylate transporter substrate binding protein [Burkholderiaceae bacterium]|nr:tripartite tricarboxylate transporter substrate binding protein [Burkholderiaceae bacterium]